MDISSNRTKWPTTGGAIAVQPGWFSGHEHALIYINLGLGNVPVNYSLPMLPVFQIIGPRNTPYPGDGFCLPQVPLPTNVTVKAGDNATIQIVEAAVHGAALYNVSRSWPSAVCAWVPEADSADDASVWISHSRMIWTRWPR